ncbi:MAG TPA: aminotransferase class V-fold PLP-dependent enzyme [Patescibacteria group bacterium]|nr:aminotransferase class V-fold PLP-dependent enzyme [Patescibacteria group bacterium]
MLSLDRKELFPQLPSGVVYADWTGAALPPAHLVHAHADFLTRDLLGNPHSHHSSSARAMEQVNEARETVLAYFNADPDEYVVVWTQNASAAILLLQHYMWQGGELLLTADNHNTMNGIREIARRDGAIVRYSPINEDLSLDADALRQRLMHPRTNHHRVFGFPAMSNYSGALHDLEWVSLAQEHGWDVILDAAAYLANNRLDLSRVKPQFVPMSFYKMFGFPTGVGALLVRKDVFARMDKRWFAGGTILLVSVMADFYALEPAGPARFEDGTVNFQMMPAVTRGLRWLDTLGDRKVHANAIARTLRDGLLDLRVGDNSIRVHSPPDTSVVTFSVLRTGETVNAWEVEHAADEVGIHVRTGCFCNPGANERTMGYTVNEFEVVYNDGASANDFTLEKLREHSGGKPIGAIRASFGYANTLEDAHRILGFLREYLGSL